MHKVIKDVVDKLDSKKEDSVSFMERFDTPLSVLVVLLWLAALYNISRARILLLLDDDDYYDDDHDGHDERDHDYYAENDTTDHTLQCVSGKV